MLNVQSQHEGEIIVHNAFKFINIETAFFTVCSGAPSVPSYVPKMVVLIPNLTMLPLFACVPVFVP